MTARAQPESYPTREQVLRQDYLDGNVTLAHYERALDAHARRGSLYDRCPYRDDTLRRLWAYRLPIDLPSST